MVIITIDGNIGCGKTGVLNYLHKNYKYPIDLEPVDNWHKYLVKIYNKEQQTENSTLSNIFNFQVRIWLDRCWIQKKIDNNVIIVERSPNFIRNVFIKNAINDNKITILFDKKTLDLKGWQILDQYNNNINFSLNIVAKNNVFKKGTFKIPEIN